MERFESSIQASNRKHAQEKDSNPQDERFESFNEKVETRSKDLNPQQEWFDSLWKKFKQKWKKEKGFESPHERFKSFI